MIYATPGMWLESLASESAQALARRSKARRQPARRASRLIGGQRLSKVEPLEKRTLFSPTPMLTVTNMTDTHVDGQLSLREALASASGSDYVISIPAGTIDLTQGVLTADDAGYNLTLQNVGGEAATIDGQGQSTVLQIAPGTTATVTGLTITGGQGSLGDDSTSGGGIFNGGTLTVDDCTITGNAAATYGGGIMGHFGVLSVIDSTLTDNSAPFGGGIGSYTATIAIINSTISANSGSNTGGLFNIYGTTVCTDSTFDGNVDGGVFNYAGTDTFDGTVIADSTGAPDLRNIGTISGSDDLVGDGSGAASGITDPLSGPALLAPLGNYGGDTQTMPPLPGSPALGNGAVFDAAGGLDQRGAARSASAPTIGAFESQGFVVTATGGGGQSTAAGSAFNDLTVHVTANDTGVPVTGGVVTFSAPLSGASASFGSPTATVDGDGNASASAAANPIAGAYDATASAGPAPSTNATFSLTNVPSPVTVVDSLADTHVAGQTDLREALALANGASIPVTIEFQPNLSGNIDLTSVGDSTYGPSALLVTGDVTIDAANGGTGITIDRGGVGAPAMRLIAVASSGSLTVEDLTLGGGLAQGGDGGTGGSYGGGGGGAAGLGGAVFNSGTLVIQDSTLSGNMAMGGAGVSRVVGGFGGGGGGGLASPGENASTTNNDGGAGGSPNGGAGGSGGPGANATFGGGGGGGGGNDDTGNAGTAGFGGGGGGGNGDSLGSAGGFGGGGGGTGLAGTFAYTYDAPGGFGGGAAQIWVGGGGAGMGGAIFNDAGAVTISNSSIAGNQADGGAGAGNGKGLGGAVFNYNGTLSATSATISGNTADDGGRGIFSIGYGPTGTATATISNTIIGQSDTSVTDFVGTMAQGGTSVTSGTGNLIGAASGFNGTVVSSADPELGPLAGNGGYAQTLLPASGSPALGAGDPAALGGATTDQRGAARTIQGLVDIGAVEVHPLPVTVNDGYVTAENTTLTTEAATGVLVNDTDAEGDPLSAALVAGPSNGTLTLNSDGSFSYVPNDGFLGTDSFTYTANAGVLSGNTATVTITVAPYAFVYAGTDVPATVNESGANGSFLVANNSAGQLEWSVDGGNTFSTQWGADPADTLDASADGSVTINLTEDNSAVTLGSPSSPASSASALGVAVIVNALPGNTADSLYINDGAATVGGSYTYDGASRDVTGPVGDINIQEGSAPFGGGVTIQGSNSGDAFDVVSTYDNAGVAEPLTILGGTGDNTASIEATAAGATATVNLGPSPNNVVNVGTAGSLANIDAAVIVTDPTTLNIDDHSDTTNATATLDNLSGNGNAPYEVTGLSPAPIEYGVGVTAVNIDGGTDGVNGVTFAVNNTQGGTTTTIAGGPNQNFIDLSNASEINGMDHLPGAVVVEGGASLTDAVTLNDSSTPFNDNYTITSTTVSRVVFGGLTYDDNIGTLTLDAENTLGSNGNNTIDIDSTANNVTTNINGQGGDDTINVNNTGTSGTLNIAAGTGAGSTVNVAADYEPVNIDMSGPTGGFVNIGSASGPETMNGIQGAINISGPGNYALAFHDQDNRTPRTWTLDNNSPASATVAMSQGIATTTYRPEDLGGSLTINGGSGGNRFDVNSTANEVPTYLNTGIGNDTVNVLATGDNTLNIDGQAGQDVVNLGGVESAGMQDLNGTINVSNDSGSSVLTLDDSQDPTGRTATLNDNSTSGTVTGFSPATINYTDAQINALNILGGSGSNTFNVNGDPSNPSVPSFVTTLNSGSGPSDAVNVAATSTGDELDLTGAGTNQTVTVGSNGSAAQILGTVNADEAPASTALTVNMANDALDHALTLSSDGTTSTLHDSSASLPGDVAYNTAALSSLTVNTDGSNNQVLVVNFGQGGNPIPSLFFNAGTAATGKQHILAFVGQLPSGAFASETVDANDPADAPATNQYGFTQFDDGTTTKNVWYTGLSSMSDIAPAVNYTFNDFGNDNSFTAADGPVVSGAQTIEFDNTPVSGTPTFQTTDIANKRDVTFNTTATVSVDGTVNIPTASTGLTSLAFNTPTNGENSVRFASTPSGVVTSLVGGTSEDSTTVAGTSVAAGTTLQLNGGAGINTLNYDAGGQDPFVVQGGSPGEVIIGLPGGGSVDAIGYENVNISDVARPNIISGGSFPLSTVQGVSLTNAVVGSFSIPLPFINGAQAALPGSDFAASVFWGDGPPTPGTVLPDANNPDYYYVTGTHTYSGSGSYSAVAQVTFSGASYSSLLNGVSVSVTLPSSFPLSSQPVPVTVTQASLALSVFPLIGSEGSPIASGPIATFIDGGGAQSPAFYTALISITNAAGYSLTLPAASISEVGSSSQYTVNAPSLSLPDTGTYQVTVTVTAQEGQTQQTVSGTASALIADAPLSAGSPVNLTLNTGAVPSTTTVGSFTDPNPTAPVGDFTAVVNWGDGTSSAGTIFQPGGVGTPFQVSGSHAYATPGNYNTQISVADAGGSTVMLVGTATVTDLPVTGSTKNFTAVAGQSTGQFVLATFEDPDTLATVSDVNAKLAVGGWGDGTPSNAGTLLVVQQSGVDPSNSDPIFEVLGSHVYNQETPPGLPNSLSVIITTLGGDTTTLTSPPGGGVTVTDAALTGSSGNQIAGVEGNSTGSVLLGTFVDASPASAASDFTTGSGSIVIDWGDGSAPQTLASGNLTAVSTSNGVTWAINAAHTYSVQGTYAYTVTVTDSGGAAAIVAGSAAIADAPISSISAAPQSGNTGVLLSGNTVGTFTVGDPLASIGNFTATIDWGDGSAQSSGDITQPGGIGTAFTVTGNHIYAQAGVYSVTAGIRSVGGATANLTDTFTITDLPVSGSTKNFTAVAGQNTGQFVLATFEDPDTLATVSDVNATLAVGGWGDGTPSNAGTSLVVQQSGVDPSNSDPIFEVLGSHVYNQETPPGLPNSLSVIITTLGGDTTTLTSPPGGGVTVTDAALTGSSGNQIAGVEGNSTGSVLLGTFVDASPASAASDFTTSGGSIVIDWGDGSAPQTLASGNLTAVSTSNVVSWAINAAHTYIGQGTYAYTVTVTDAGGAATIVSGSATIADAALTAVSGANLAQNTGIAPESTAVGAFTDANPIASTGAFTANINWGDGTSSAGTISQPGGVGTAFQVYGSHAYATPGNYNTLISVTDAGGSTVTLFGSATVTDLPVSGSTKNFTAVAGQNTGQFVLATFEDPDTLATVSDVNAKLAVGGWGDGTPSNAGTSLVVQQTGVDPSNSDPIFEVLGSHVYNQETPPGLPNSLSVIITTLGGDTTTLTSPPGGGVTVTDAALTGSSGNQITGIIGNSTGPILLGTFVDASPASAASDFTTSGGSIVIDWGDGSAPQTLASGNLTAVSTSNVVSWAINAAHTYIGQGTYAYTVTVTDAGGAATIVSGSATIADAALTAVSGANLAQNTGIAPESTAVGAFTDANPIASTGAFTANINWGDGTSSAGTISQPGGVGTAFQVYGSHAYATPGNYNTLISVTDAGGSTVTLFGSATVTDLPVSGSTKNFTAVAGQNTGQFVLATFEDPDTLATVSDVNAKLAVGGWGDGTPSNAGTLLVVQQTGVDPSNSDPIFEVLGSHVYNQETPPGLPNSLSVIITTLGGDTTTLTSPPGGGVTVTDAALTGSSGNQITGIIGNSTGSVLLGTFVDASPASAASDFTTSGGSIVIDWGDGSAPQTLASGNLTAVSTSNVVSWAINAAHTYIGQGTYAYTVTVTDAGGAATIVSGSATIADAALTAVSGANLAQNTGIAPESTAVGAFTDANPIASTGAFTANIIWGDGTSSAGTIFQPGGVGTPFQVYGSHAYATPGNYNTQISIADAGGSTVTLAGTATVTDLPVSGAGNNIPAIEGASTGSIVLATFTDPNPLATAASLTAALPDGWGDGSPAAPGDLSITPIGSTATSTLFAVTGSHTYAEYGSYAVNVSVKTSGGVSTQLASGTATVADAPLSAGSGNPVSTTAGAAPAAFTVATFSDGNTGANIGDFTGTVTATSSTGQIVTGTAVAFTRQGNGLFSVSADLAFPTRGTWSVATLVSDTGGSQTLIGTTAFVSPIPVSITLTTPTLTYNGSPQPATATTTPGGIPVSFTYDGSSTVPTEAGTYSIIAISADPDYAGIARGSLVIAPAAPTIALATPASATYDASVHGATAVVTGISGTVLAGPATLTYFAGASATGTPLPGAPADAGTYTVLATYAGGTDYAPASHTATYSVSQATPTVVVDLPANATYDNTLQGATAAVTGVSGGVDPGSATLTYFAGTNSNGTPLPGAPTDAGTYTVLATYPGSIDYVTASSTATYTVAQATPDLVVTPPLNVTYDNTVHGATVAVTGVIGGADPGSATLTYFAGANSNGTPLPGAPTDAGTYTVLASYAGSTDYMTASSTATYTIAQATPDVVVTPPLNATYDDTIHGATAAVTGVSGGADPGSATLTYFTGTGTAGTPLSGAPTDAGTYTVEASDPGNLDYQPAEQTTTYTIGQAAAQVSITTPPGAVYDATPHVATVTVTGVSGGADPGDATLTYFAGSGAVGTPLPGAPVDAGTYTVQATYPGGIDYAPAAPIATYVIAAATPIVEIHMPTAATYDGTPYSASVTITGVNDGASPGAAVRTYFAGPDTSGTLLPGAPTDAGTYTVQAVYAGTTDYAPVTQVATFTIAPATAVLAITPPIATTYDGTPKPATVTITGAPLGAVPATPTLLYFAGQTLDGTLLPGAPTEPGIYTVLATHVAEPNYAFVNQAIAYTIPQATPIVTINAANMQYNGAAQPATATVTGAANGAVPGPATLTYFAGTNTSGTPLTSAPVNVGTYTVQASYAGSAEYAPVVAAVTYMIYGIPTAGPVTGTGLPGSDVSLAPLSNAATTDGGTLSLGVLTQPAFGSVSVVTVGGTQQFLYHPGPGVFTGDSFTYQVNDSFGGNATATATVNYAGVGLVSSSLNLGAKDLVVVENSGNHTVTFANGSSARILKVTLDGVVQGSYTVSGRVFGFAGSGTDLFNGSSISRSLWLYGGTGNNTFIGGSGGDVLIGGTGNDYLNGRTGKNILIGGGGTNTLVGSSGSDILVAGSTLYDAPSFANQSALLQILTAWQSAKTAPSIPSSVGSGFGGNGTPPLDRATISADTGDILVGNKKSWFFGNFTFNGGTDVFNDGRHIQPNHYLTPLKSERVTQI